MGLCGAWATAGVGRPGARVISSAARAISCQIGRITDISLHVRQAIRFEGLTGQELKRSIVAPSATTSTSPLSADTNAHRSQIRHLRQTVFATNAHYPAARSRYPERGM